MFRRILCFLSAAGFVMALKLPASGRELGTIRIRPQWCGTELTGGRVALYRVGEPVEGGFRVTDGLASWDVWEEELSAGYLMDWLLAQNRICSQESAVTEGGVIFSGLKEGLYLVTQTEPSHGYTAFDPVLQQIPDGEQWDILRSPAVVSLAEPPSTGDRPAPIIAAMGISLAVAALMVLADRRK